MYNFEALKTKLALDMKRLMFSLFIYVVGIVMVYAISADYNVVPRPQTITLAKEGAY